MDDVSKEPKAKEERHELPKKKSWSSTDAEALQQAVDAVFNRAGESLLGLTFSLTIADPRLPDIPLIGCSTGFATLCGYTMEEILGRSLGLLGGGFEYFLCSSLPGEMIQFDACFSTGLKPPTTFQCLFLECSSSEFLVLRCF